ncbi:hypothetical protein [Enterovirga aerilata]|uniref:Uncharacterized protein n=1 Tax=Enterovirga aerilata TaxID=2730920 RepID=A0A849I0U9_9HYPH|nr:hypothetical protein [Enterovirga sp. DB1703]NNM72972.1 hypothetical protein [Enterovirga sp. DB1703]
MGDGDPEGQGHPGADWARAEQDLRWCLLDGRGVEGRDVLFDAVQMKDPARRRAALHNGFMMSRRDEESTSNFVACEREDAIQLFNIARRIVGLAPVS